MFWLAIFGLYAIGIAFVLLRGKRWARFLALGFGAWQPGAVWDLRGQIYVGEALLKTSVAVLLLLPASRKWFARRSAAKPAQTG